jgi:hypothetical protein
MKAETELARLIREQAADLKGSRSRRVEAEREPDEEEVEPEEEFEEEQEEL